MDPNERVEKLENDLISLILGKVKSLDELESLTKEMADTLLKEGLPLGDVPDRLVDDQVYIDSVELEPRNIVYCPDHLKTPELITSVLERNGMLLDAIDENLLTKDLCEVALKQNASAIWIVPEDMVTRGLCKTAIEGGADPAHIPIEFRSEMEEYKESLSK